MGKISEKLAALVAAQEPEKEVRLNVMLRRGVDRESVTSLADELARLAADGASVELLPAAGIVMWRGTLGAVERIASHPAVEWIDLDTESPVEDLLDN